jgi:energy-coupling factor transport system ATP-binding protein
VPGVIPGERHGEIILDGADPAALPPRQRVGRVGLVLQDPDSQLAAPSVRSELALILENQGVEPGEISRNLENTLEELEIGHLSERRVHELSGGEKQLVAIAAFAVRPPKLLLLDEPGAYLDERNRRRVYGFLQRLRERRPDMAMAFVEHRTDGLPRPEQVILLSGGTALSYPEPSAVPAALGHGVAELWGDRFPSLPRRRSESAPLLRVEELRFSWSKLRGGPPLLQGINLQLRPGEVTVLRGANGSGKTTLLRLIAGARKAGSGRILRSQECRLAYVPQNPEHLFVSYTVRSELEEAVAFGRAGHGGGARRPEAAAGDGAETSAARFGLSELLEANPFELSTGQKRRLNMATVAAIGASVVLLDEPTFGLDTSGVTQLIEMVGELREGGAHILVATHDTAFALAVADRFITLRQGTLTEEALHV